MRTSWLLSTALLIVATAAAAQNDPYGPVEPGPEDQMIASFTAEQTDRRTFTFRWTFESDDQGETMVCSLNVNGDEVNEVQIENCHEDRQVQHRYEREGAYTVTLIARSRDGGADRSTVRVRVR